VVSFHLVSLLVALIQADDVEARLVTVAEAFDFGVACGQAIVGVADSRPAPSVVDPLL